MFNLAHGLATWLFRSPGSQLARRPPPAGAALSLATNARRERAAAGPPRCGEGAGHWVRRACAPAAEAVLRLHGLSNMRCGTREAMWRTPFNKDGLMRGLAGSDHDEAPPQTPAGRSFAQAQLRGPGTRCPARVEHD